MKKLIVSLFLVAGISAAQADEGMWMLGNLNKKTRNTMKEMGLNLPANKLYNPNKTSLTDAVVSFGGFCSGVVVSEDGLVFTNHHCGFSAIQQHSTVEHNYLDNGFAAPSHEYELPNPELYVRFLVKTENVTKRILKDVNDTTDEKERSAIIDSLKYVIQEEVYKKDSTLVAIVDTYYGGNEFWLSVYQDYNDVRLVFAPPSSVGKFGWDTDNWIWPRHTGDFSVFRIYAGKDNKPANYSPDNVPYRPKHYSPISLKGYNEGSFCMTLGYPGTTDRYLSSFGIEDRMYTLNQALIDVRGVKQTIWKKAMDADPDIRIKYASKYDESSNYWKNSIGTNKSILELGILDKKREMEAALLRWIQQTPAERDKLLHLLSSLELNYKAARETNRAMYYMSEAFMNSPEIILLSLEILNFDYEADKKDMTASLRKILEKYENMNPEIDKTVFLAMIKEYRNQVDTIYLPDFYSTIATEFQGNDEAFVDSLYSNTKLDTPLGLRLFADSDSEYSIIEDPIVGIAIDILAKVFEMNQTSMEATTNIARDERLYNAAVRRMYADKNFYPDANSTMRLSFGTVRGYTPFDGGTYDYYTTAAGILEKAKAHYGDRDFRIQPELAELLSSNNFGRYADKNGDMSVCFISDNDITGGNSGSAMFNDKGELLGLAFDGNWEAMSSNYRYEPTLQRCIGVDVRYMLFIIEKYGKATHLINELKIMD
ncbi:S46 family peptidase [Bacteroides sp. 519]|uniref:S46 family peptidase n=1 Tax=Bacteroides sp. 519 TaxID=2302937 RepID=UPI0013D03F9A|nr:S46 family peptidase [Bacteroides sp. 519]NDV58090.1 S46 family peptidase [Bacteroides sp. 519]